MRLQWLPFVLVLGLFAVFLIDPTSGWPVQQFLVFGPHAREEGSRLSELLLENAALRAGLAELKEVAKNLPFEERSYQRVFIYSRYPFNLRNEILINAGESSWIKVGKPAVLLPAASNGTFAPPLLVGKVVKVFEDSAVVQTLFDPTLQIPARVGDASVDALFQGGAEPRLTLIEKKAIVRVGEVAYAATSGLPYGLVLGTVRDVRLSADALFQEAVLDVPYDLNKLRTLSVLR